MDEWLTVTIGIHIIGRSVSYKTEYLVEMYLGRTTDRFSHCQTSQDVEDEVSPAEQARRTAYIHWIPHLYFGHFSDAPLYITLQRAGRCTLRILLKDTSIGHALSAVGVELGTFWWGRSPTTGQPWMMQLRAEAKGDSCWLVCSLSSNFATGRAGQVISPPPLFPFFPFLCSGLLSPLPSWDEAHYQTNTDKTKDTVSWGTQRYTGVHRY